MDFDLKQWKVQQQQESEESLLQQPCAKIPRLQSSSLLPFFVPEPCTNLSAFSDSTDTRFSGLGCFFSLAQRQELELQALIFKYMLVNAPIPPELLLPIKTSLLHNTSSPASACFLYPYQQYQHYQQPMLHSGYWGKSLIDPEPGRCRRTDGKKWRCAREVVLGHKYCERHVHRGRNRSRKLVENATPIATKGAIIINNPTPLAHLPIAIAASKCANLVQLNQRGLEERRGNLDIQNGKLSGDESGAEGRLLRQFFDDWPRPNETSNGVGGPSTTGISITSTPSSDTEFSLKLSTGNVDDTVNGGEEASPQLDWGTGWSGHQASSMGGPLAEALRSSITNASPTSVLYTGTASETSSATT